MSVIAVFSAKTYCLYGCETWRMSSSDKHKLKVAWNNCFRKFFNACWRESAKPLLFYCGTMPVSLLVDQIKTKRWHVTISCQPDGRPPRPVRPLKSGRVHLAEGSNVVLLQSPYSTEFGRESRKFANWVRKYDDGR